MSNRPQGRYWTSGTKLDQLPPHGAVEVAFCGRSNVGKSSLLGMLLGSPRIVRTSRTPGRTQLVNLFNYGEDLVLADLPGYGYAKLSLQQRAQMHAMIGSYVRGREELRGVLLLLDARREEVAEQDRQMAAMAMEAGREVLLVATKSDLLGKNVRLNTLRRLEKSFGVPPGYTLACSSKTGEGKTELHARLRELAAK